MKTVDISTLPILKFAHSYRAPHYASHFPARTNRIEFTYIFDGSFTVTDQGESVILNKGDVLVSLFDSPRSVVAESEHCHHTVAADLEFTVSEDSPDGLYLPSVTRAASVPVEIYRILDGLIARQNLQKLQGIGAQTEFLTLLTLLDKSSRRALLPETPSEVLLTEKAKKYVSDHLHEPIRQAETANFLGVSPGYLCAVFKRVQRVSFIHYVNLTKLQSIRVLTGKEGITLQEAARLFGFADPNYVSRLFKKYFGHNFTDRT